MLDRASVYGSGHGSILGASHLELDGTAFPSEGGTDFVVEIIGWCAQRRASSRARPASFTPNASIAAGESNDIDALAESIRRIER